MATEYTAGGKGRSPRQEIKPSWLGLKEVSRDKNFVTFNLKDRVGWRSVALAEVERWEKRQMKK